MFFQIEPTVPDEDFSWIISKNPNGALYERRVGGASTGRRVIGSFLPNGAYQMAVHNDGVLFFNEMRARNEAAYIRPEPWIVCPSNLKGFSTIFRSALHGDVGKDIPPERFNAPKSLRAIIGPFPRDRQGEERIWTKAFEALGLSAEIVEEGTTQAFTIVLLTIAPMPITTFLQKIYSIMMALTAKWAFFDKIDDAKIESYLRLTTTWLHEVEEPYRAAIVNKLTGYHKNLQARFETPDQLVPEVRADLEKEERETEIVKKVSLHEMRHQLILANMTLPETDDASAHPLIVDLGSGEGKLLAGLLSKFPKANILGIDANRERIWRTKRKIIGRHRDAQKNREVQIYHDNLLFPRNWAELANADVLIASEVIEHMRLGDRAHFIRLITELLEPKILFITTPNIEVNESMFGMNPGVLRHDDHKIEYTHAQFEAEVVQPLSIYYDVTYLDVMPGEAIQPSFCIKAVRKDVPSSSAKGYISHVIKRMAEPSYFPVTDVTVSSKDMREGCTTYAFLENSRSIFYLGPTIAPVDYISELDQYLVGASEGGPFLEHPLAAFEYFAARGVTTLVEEPKYMGSRGYALIFRDPDQARSFGFEQPIIMNARSGGSFFKDESQAMAVWQDMAPKLQDDFIILDAEVMPWALKAERLIARDFILPGEAALLWRRRNQPDNVDNVERYLKMVKLYGAGTPLEIRAFHILARGKVKRAKYKMQFDEPRYGFYRTHTEQLLELAALEGDIVKPASHRLVDLNDASSKASSVQRWREYCEDGGEGFVYKPPTFLTMSATGYPLQAALKVRGKDYLRIIYGMDYLEPVYFDRLKQRGTRMKRLLAVQEQEIAMSILRTFINGNEIERLRAIGAFLGLEWAQATTIDKTL